MGSRKDMVTQFAEIAADLRDATRPGASDSERTRQIIINGIASAMIRAGFSPKQSSAVALIISYAVVEVEIDVMEGER